MKPRYRVIITDYEQGTSKEVSRRYFAKKEAADKFVHEYNAQNTLKKVPDSYAVASEPKLVDMNEEENR